uniref:mS35 n=1 Tax=Trypanosoma brucei TaxID=5691 RepID=UPI003B642BE9
MRRWHRSLNPALFGERGSGHYFSTTRARLQLQAQDRIICGTHGAGIVAHQTAVNSSDNPMLSSVTTAAPAADLSRTKPHEGTGTSERDPYIRTLHNQRSAAPESSVSQSHTVNAPTVDECEMLAERWGTMNYWHNDTFPRLVVFLKKLLVPDVSPLSPTAESLLSMFEKVVIPKLTSDEEDRRKLVSLWSETTLQAEAAVTKFLFQRGSFESMLHRIITDALEKMSTLALGGQEGNLALEALKRQTLFKRNDFIQKRLIDVVSNSAYLGYGDSVWQVFFAAVEANEENLLSDRATTDAIRAAWEGVMREDVVRLPDVTGVVALYLTLVCIRESGRLVPEELKELSSGLEDGVRPGVRKLQQYPLIFLHPTVKRRFVVKAVAEILHNSSSNAFSNMLRENGLHDTAREVALCEAMNRNKELAEGDVGDAVGRFVSKGEVKTLLSSLVSGTDAVVRDAVAGIFGIGTTITIDWDAVMQNVDWSNNWQRLATALLSNSAVLSAIVKLVKNAIGAKGMSKHLFTDEYADQLQLILDAREERAASRKQRIENIAQELSSFERVDLSCDLLRKLGVDMTELDTAAAATRNMNVVQRPCIEDGLLSLVLEAVTKRHPNWVKAGVIQTTLKDPFDALRWMMHIFIRLSYVPHAGAATIARLSRRRIGPIGLEPHQFNVPAELGFVEQYDNLQYKRYDWQGWYQRMLDVHNRNVSLRCRICDLQRLDGNGVQFVDMQTERRLRILAQHRVGMGVLKLDADKYEDQADNVTFGTTKLSELLADARKAQLGEEYWPSVELKVRKPSGQSKAHYSLIDNERIEKRSRELYEKYRDAKKRSLFVTPMETWLEVKGMQVRKSVDNADEDGYTLDALQDMMDGDDGDKV